MVSFSIHAINLMKLLQKSDDGDLVQELLDLIPDSSEDDRKPISKGIASWIRFEIYGSKWRSNVATTPAESLNPVDMIRHVGRMIKIGHLKYFDQRLAAIFEQHYKYSDKYLMLCFLEWVIAKNPYAKAKFKLQPKPNRISIKDQFKSGCLISGWQI